jgi:DNA-binding NarL/FixJ family response regulator
MTRVLIATNEPILAKGLEAVLTAGGLEIAAVCHDVIELFECLQRCRPDFAVLDMPVLPGPEVIHDLRRLAPHCQLVLWPRLTLSDSPDCVAEAIHMMTPFSRPDPSPSALVNLTCSPGERELITLVSCGLSNEEIAAAMGSDRLTVQKLLKNLSDRLGAGDRYELALYGLTTLNDPDRYEGRI